VLACAYVFCYPINERTPRSIEYNCGLPIKNPLFLFYVGLKGRLSSKSVCFEKSKIDHHPNFDQKSARYQNIQGS